MDEENNIIKIRLEQFLIAENMTSLKFAEIMEIQPSNISHFMKGRNKPNFDFISRFLLRFPTVSPDWFLNGIGNMYRSDYRENVNNPDGSNAAIPTADLFSFEDNSQQEDTTMAENITEETTKEVAKQTVDNSNQTLISTDMINTNIQETSQQQTNMPQQPDKNTTETLDSPKPISEQSPANSNTNQTILEIQQPHSDLGNQKSYDSEINTSDSPKPISEQSPVNTNTNPTIPEIQQPHSNCDNQQSSVPEINTTEVSSDITTPKQSVKCEEPYNEKHDPKLVKIVMFYDDYTFVEYNSK